MMFGFVSYRGRAQVLLAAVGAFSLSAASQAELLPGYATGVGENTSAFIIDFEFIGGDSYYFEYHYDGDAVSSEQALLDLNTAGDLDVDSQFFTFGGVSSIFINGFSFEGSSSIPVFGGAQGESWRLIVADAADSPLVWEGFGLGATDRFLSDGSIDGWSLNITDFVNPELSTDFTPGAFTAAELAEVSGQLEFFPVPEPSSAALLALLGTALLRRRRQA